MVVVVVVVVMVVLLLLVPVLVSTLSYIVSVQKRKVVRGRYIQELFNCRWGKEEEAEERQSLYLYGLRGRRLTSRCRLSHQLHTNLPLKANRRCLKHMPFTQQQPYSLPKHSSSLNRCITNN
jgi:hypothetical protein